jgi:hypothetical protein
MHSLRLCNGCIHALLLRALYMFFLSPTTCARSPLGPSANPQRGVAPPARGLSGPVLLVLGRRHGALPAGDGYREGGKREMRVHKCVQVKVELSLFRCSETVDLCAGLYELPVNKSHFQGVGIHI